MSSVGRSGGSTAAWRERDGRCPRSGPVRQPATERAGLPFRPANPVTFKEICFIRIQMAPTLIGTGSRDGESAMSTPARCPSCGALRPASAPEGLCPRCVLRHAIESGGPSDCESAHDWSRTGPVLKTLAMTVGSVPRVQLVDVESTAGLEPRERVDRYEDEDNLSQASHLGSSSVSVPLGADGRLESAGRDRARRHGRCAQGPRHRPRPRPGRQGVARNAQGSASKTNGTSRGT